MLIVVENRPNFSHVRYTVVIFRSQGELAKVAKLADPDGIKVPAYMPECVQIRVVGVQDVNHVATHFGVTDPLEFLKGSESGQGIPEDP